MAIVRSHSLKKEREFSIEIEARNSKTEEEIARGWRDLELKNTDWIIPITDHPERTSYLTYRTNLRDWPSTDDFPETRPTL